MCCQIRERVVDEDEKFKYVKPKTIEEALGYLDDNVNEKKVIAGGTDLMVKLKNNKIAPDLIIDISDRDLKRHLQERWLYCYWGGKLHLQNRKCSIKNTALSYPRRLHL